MLVIMSVMMPVKCSLMIVITVIYTTNVETGVSIRMMLVGVETLDWGIHWSVRGTAAVTNHAVSVLRRTEKEDMMATVQMEEFST